MEPDFWGELRLRLKGPRTRPEFIELWRWLGLNPDQLEREEVRAYLREHLLAWPQSSRVLWEDELEAPLDRFKLWIQLVKPHIPTPSPLRSIVEKQPASVATPQGPVTLTSAVNGELSYLFVEHAGVYLSKARPCWVYEHSDWSAQIRAFVMEEQTPGVLGSALLSYKLVAHADLDQHVVMAQWYPEPGDAQLGHDCGQHLAAQTWFEAPEVHEGDWMREGEERHSRQFCLGTNDEEVMVERARGWWPGNRSAGAVTFPLNGLHIKLPKMKQGQRIRVWFAFAWGFAPNARAQQITATSNLLDRSDDFDDASA